jgi:hypothetical protein
MLSFSLLPVVVEVVDLPLVVPLVVVLVVFALERNLLF